MSSTQIATPSSNAGFTLIELMIVVVVIGILAAIAIPLYGDSVTRSKIVGATTQLGDVRTQMEKYFMDNRTYLNLAACGADPSIVAYNADASNNFTLTCNALVGPPESYVITATGIAAKGMGGFTYTIDQTSLKASVGPGGKYTNAGCWALRKDGSC
ncbi:MAG: prepilin-type N-terminal cleavage/methylation domain-containing protein [Casimicrobiaceae bacterium]